MIEMYKILTGKYDPEVSNFVKLNNSKQATRGHKYKIEKEHVKLNIRKQSFVQRSVDLWNSLPPQIVKAETVLGFEIKLEKHGFQI